MVQRRDVTQLPREDRSRARAWLFFSRTRQPYRCVVSCRSVAALSLLFSAANALVVFRAFALVAWLAAHQNPGRRSGLPVAAKRYHYRYSRALQSKERPLSICLSFSLPFLRSLPRSFLLSLSFLLKVRSRTMRPVVIALPRMY